MKKSEMMKLLSLLTDQKFGERGVLGRLHLNSNDTKLKEANDAFVATSSLTLETMAVTKPLSWLRHKNTSIRAC